MFFEGLQEESIKSGEMKNTSANYKFVCLTSYLDSLQSIR